jgi:hypothetical protein
MYYRVDARLRPENAAEFLRKLSDGSIAGQEPDGEEIVDSMHRARVSNGGRVRWSEVCYCPTPLEHERATVYDHFFTDLETERIKGYADYDGEPFMDYLARTSAP